VKGLTHNQCVAWSGVQDSKIYQSRSDSGRKIM